MKRQPKEIELLVRQSPVAARTCSLQDNSNIRFLDPPFIVEVVFKSTNPSTEELSSIANSFIGHVSLLAEDGQTDCSTMMPCLNNHVPKTNDGYYQPPRIINNLTGGATATAFYLCDIDKPRTPKLFFVFPDLGVRLKGKYRFKLTVTSLEG
jgi:hypothetical protein